MRHVLPPSVRSALLLALWLVGVAGTGVFGAWTAQAEPVVTAMTRISAYPSMGIDTTELVCLPKPHTTPKAPTEPMELPSDDDLAGLSVPPPTDAPAPVTITHPKSGFKVALFGDSHLAAGSFSGELIRLSGLDAVTSQLIPATVDRPGVRLNLKRVCSSGGWQYEASYAGIEAAQFPGPGLSSARAPLSDAQLSFDLRLPNGTAWTTRVSVLYHQSDIPQRLAIRVDRGEALTVELPAGPPQPAQLEIIAPRPISIVSLTTQSTEFRFQGLKLPTAPRAALTLDSFGYPGATVMGFDKANVEYWAQWFTPNDYDAVVLWFGTNEGNVPSFDASAYELGLRASLSKMRRVFPTAACLLVGPADRGVITPAAHKKRKRLKTHQRQQQLLKYSLIHAQINQIQQRVGSEFQCQAFDLQRAMGGLGSAYRWSKSTPRKMAPDLIHFTPAGYRELADAFAHAIGWDERLFENPSP